MDHIISILIEYGIWGIIIVAFLEPIILPFPMELIFIPVILSNPQRAIWYSFVLIFFSALGSLVGYYVGNKGGRPVLDKLISDKNINRIEELYNKNAFITIFTSVFTPIPYEVYVLSAGIFKINIFYFISAAVLSRLLRYLTQGILVSIFGKDILTLLNGYIWLVGVILILIFITIKFFKSEVKK